eukprot:316488_1
MPPNDYPHWIKHENGGQTHNDSVIKLWDSYLLPACVAALGNGSINNSWHCGSMGNAYQFIETPLFISQNKFDTSQIESSGQMPPPSQQVTNQTIGYVEYYGGDFDRSILNQMVYSKQTKDGLFYASCFDHCQGLWIGNVMKSTFIDGYNSSALVGDWF